MYKYPKIETLFKRDENFKITDEIRLPEFENIKDWLITEKIDGTNIRVIFERENDQHDSCVTFWGRTDKAEIPLFLFETLQKMFPIEKFIEIFNEAKEVCLYGEGYGAKIQKGGGDYNKGNSFRLFDVWIDGWWLEWDSIVEIAGKLAIGTVPEVGIREIENAVDLVRGDNRLYSSIAEEENGKTVLVEGIVARAYPTMLFRNGIPIKWKLKIKDYKGGKL